MSCWLPFNILAPDSQNKLAIPRKNQIRRELKEKKGYFKVGEDQQEGNIGRQYGRERGMDKNKA